MDVFYDISDIRNDKNTVVTIGTFDGVHLGHKKIIERLKHSSSLSNGRNFVITFNPHPRSVVSQDYQMRLLNTLDEKIVLFKQLGVDNLLVIPFTRKFSSLDYKEFFEDYIIKKIGISEIILGHDHKFGKGRTGDEEKLKVLGKEYNFEVTPVPAITIDDNIVSSTKIRNALIEGDAKHANLLLGRPYSFSGFVIKGKMRGRTLGFPTANIQPDDEKKLIPKQGVYAVEVLTSDNKYNGMMNIGLRPTFDKDNTSIIEINIFDFYKDIYGEKVTVNVIERIRDEKKFSSVDELLSQLKNDRQMCLEILNRFSN